MDTIKRGVNFKMVVTNWTVPAVLIPRVLTQVKNQMTLRPAEMAAIGCSPMVGKK